MALRFDGFRDLPTRADQVIIVLDEITKHESNSTELGLQMLVHRLQKADPEVWAEFSFEERRMTPWSDDLHSVLFDLQNAGVVTTGVFGGYFAWTDEDRRTKSVAMAEKHLSWVVVDNIRWATGVISRARY